MFWIVSPRQQWDFKKSKLRLMPMSLIFSIWVPKQSDVSLVSVEISKMFQTYNKVCNQKTFTKFHLKFDDIYSFWDKVDTQMKNNWKCWATSKQEGNRVTHVNLIWNLNEDWASKTQINNISNSDHSLWHCKYLRQIPQHRCRRRDLLQCQSHMSLRCDTGSPCSNLL